MKIFVILSLLSLPLHAGILDQADCSNTDIRETNPRIKNNPELKEHFTVPRNQDSIGWCYAFSAADLMSAETGVPVSSVHASALYNKKIQNNFFLRIGYRIGDLFREGYLDQVYEGGYASWALKELIKNKAVCKEEDFPFDQNHTYETMMMIRDLEALKEKVKAKDLLKEEVCQELDLLLPYYEIVSIDTEKIAASLVTENLNLTLEKLSQELCKDDMLAVPKLKVKSAGVPNNKKRAKRFLQSMNSVLEGGRPIEFSYNTKHFAIHSGQHSSILIGRRWNNGRCEYRVRNSWGQSCASYKDNVDCDYETGTFWVSDEDFIKAAGRINYLSPE